MKSRISLSGIELRSVSNVVDADLRPVTIIVPCYNEQDGIPHLADRLRRLPAELPGMLLSFILVDDGSTDGTWDEIRRHFSDEPQFSFVRHSSNRGIAAAIHSGTLASSDEIVAVIDSDCTYDPALIGKMFPLLKDDVALVTASPYHSKGRVAGVHRWRIFLSQSASRMYRLLLRNKLATYTSCFRIYRRSALLALSRRHDGFVGVTEALVLLDRLGWRLVEFPAVLETRRFGQSKLSVTRAIVGHLKFMAWIAYARLTRQWSVLGSISLEPLKTAGE
ncbi:MAG: glycosyltransferase family 2 protein [Boseongicola sp.]